MFARHCKPVVTAIAEQTHLPALNATIEAVRAGEAARNITEAASGSGDIAHNISGVTSAANQATELRPKRCMRPTTSRRWRPASAISSDDFSDW